MSESEKSSFDATATRLEKLGLADELRYTSSTVSKSLRYRSNRPVPLPVGENRYQIDRPELYWEGSPASVVAREFEVFDVPDAVLNVVAQENELFEGVPEQVDPESDQVSTIEPTCEEVYPPTWTK